MPMCTHNCDCRACNVSRMSNHPAFKDRIDKMIQKYKRVVIGPSYFPIELVDAKDQEEGVARRYSRSSGNKEIDKSWAMLSYYMRQ